MGERRLDSSGSVWELVAGCCDFGNEPSGSVNCGEFFDLLTSHEGHC